MSIPNKPTSTIPKSDTLHVPVLGPSTSYSLLQPRVPPTCTRLTTAIPRVSRICIVALQNLHVPGQPFAPPLQAISSASRSSRQGALPAQVNECTSTSTSFSCAQPSTPRRKKAHYSPICIGAASASATPRFSKISIALLFLTFACLNRN